MYRSLASLGLAALSLGCGTLAGEPPELVAARSGDDVITVAEVDATIRQRLYELRREALDEVISQRAVERRAAAAGSTAEALIESAGDGVSDEEIRAFFSEREAEIKAQVPDATAESMAPQIRRFLASQRRRDFVRETVDQAAYRVVLEVPRVEVSVEGSPSLGPVGAAVTIVEFSDFQCPFCRRAGPVMKQLVEKYPEDVRVVYRHLPLGSHPRARPSAEASACAGEQGRFWDYHDTIFDNPNALGDDDLKRYAGELGLDTAQFDACFSSGRYAAQVRDDARAAAAVGITGTPGFVVNGRVVSGYKSLEEFDAIVREELSRAREGS